MSLEYAGRHDAHHVENSETPFAAIVEAISDLDAAAVHKTLVSAGISKKDGETGPMSKMRLEGSHSVVTIEPIKLVGAIGPEGILDRIDEQLIAGHAVALRHKSNRDPEDKEYLWTLLADYVIHDGEKGAIRVLDPRREHANYIASRVVLEMIERSTRPEGSAGIHAFALSTDQISEQ